MSHALITIITKISAKKFEQARTFVEALGNPAGAAVGEAFESVASEPGGLAIHFSSLTVFPATGGGGHLLFEFSGDGGAPLLIRALAKHLGPLVEPAFVLADDWSGQALAVYWTSHVVEVGHGYFSNPGVVFTGTPDMTVKRIRDEGRLRERLKSIVEEDRVPFKSALDTLEKVRSILAQDPAFRWALEPKDTATIHSAPSGSGPYLKIGLSVAKTFLWPLLIPSLLVLALTLWRDPTGTGAMRAVINIFIAAVATAGLALIGLGLAYAKFRRAEDADIPDSRPPDPRMVTLIQARENRAAQNHLSGISVMKPGRLRRLAVKLVFAAIEELVTHLYRPGWLGDLGTIHFARWVMVPGTGDLLFLSNYGGSWESYLEDFITKAHNGLTGVWSNSMGFPKTVNLFQQGATDGDHFKRWARRHQVPTGCWYTAYPMLTTANIRTNAAICQGLGTICTEEEARRWLLLFDAGPRPAGAMEVNEIQSLVFGGLGFLKHAMCAGFALADDRSRASGWLREVEKGVAYGDGRKHIHSAVILGLAPDALRKLRLDPDALNTFPSAYLEGMTSETRSRILGDNGGNAPQTWEWGGVGRNVDGVLLLYADSRARLDELRDKMSACLDRFGHRMVMEVPFADLPDKHATREQKWKAKLEPFGFVDGVSQPLIRGSYKALRGADPMHIVEPGEFILGYPDNRGNLPAGPTLQAIHDPQNALPISAGPQQGFAQPIVNDERDLGRNGSFLAIRQLEQNVEGFWEYCAHTATELKQQFPRWVDVNAEFVGAKLVGRWMDGSSMVRFPYHAGSEDADARQLTRTPVGTGEPAMPVPLPPGVMSGTMAPPEAAAHLPLKVRRTEESVREVAITPDNDFLFGAEDPQGLRCPFGSHIRRANPRESFEPGSKEQLAITNRHRILRVGRRYAPEKDRNPGLFFMCLNADLERQFEFVQQTWLRAPSFHGLTGERDPIVGSRHGAESDHTDDGYSIPTRDKPIRLCTMPDFVRTLGGGYFFVPGRAVLRYLGTSEHGDEKSN